MASAQWHRSPRRDLYLKFAPAKAESEKSLDGLHSLSAGTEGEGAEGPRRGRWSRRKGAGARAAPRLCVPDPCLGCLNN